jgi:hypothetical protein
LRSARAHAIFIFRRLRGFVFSPPSRLCLFAAFAALSFCRLRGGGAFDRSATHPLRSARAHAIFIFRRLRGFVFLPPSRLCLFAAFAALSFRRLRGGRPRAPLLKGRGL